MYIIFDPPNCNNVDWYDEMSVSKGKFVDPTYSSVWTEIYYNFSPQSDCKPVQHLNGFTEVDKTE